MAEFPVDPRPLSELESGVVGKLLSADVQGAAELRNQIPFVTVVATWGEGSPSVDLRVAPGADPAGLPDGELPVSGLVHDKAGAFVGEITLWLAAGYLSAIEFGWVTDDRPTSLPDPALISVSP